MLKFLVDAYIEEKKTSKLYTRVKKGLIVIKKSTRV